MNKNNSYILTLVLLLLSFSNIFAQVSSPYSQFGFGDNSGSGFGQSRAMGNIGIGLRTDQHLNNINPASYNALDTMVVIYELGVSFGKNKIESNLSSLNKTDGQIDYFALGFLINRHWATSFGLAPSSKVNYTLMSSVEDPVDGTINTYFNGNGGLSKIYWGNAFRLTKRLSIGINSAFVFGPVNKTTTIAFIDNRSCINSKMEINEKVYNFIFNYGVQYTQPLGKDYSLTLGAVFENKTKLNTTVDTLAGTTTLPAKIDASYYEGIHTNEIINTMIDTSGAKSKIDYPSSFGFGFTLVKGKQLTIGADVLMQKWSSLTSNDKSIKYNDLISVHAGAEFTPDRNSINYYMERMSYRIGGHFTESQLEIRNTRINDYGISFGVGLPLRNANTSINITGEIGRRGTIEQNLIRETYGVISINLSLSDIWFFKHKIR